MDNQQGQQAEIKPSTSVVHSRSEHTRYLPMPAGPTVVNFPPHFTDILSENRFAQAVTVDQQRELTQYARGLNGWMEREFGERHDDLRRLRAAFEQMGRDVRDLQDDGSTSSNSHNGLENVEVPPQQVPKVPANPPAQRPLVIPNQRQPLPVNSQPQPIVVVIPTTYAPRPIPAVPGRFRPQQPLPPPQQPSAHVSLEPPPFIPPGSSSSGVQSSHPSSPTPHPPGPGHMDPYVTIIPASSSSSQSHETPGDHILGIHRRNVNQPFPTHPRQSMGSDVFVVPLSSASTRSSPARGMTGPAQRPSVTSLRERDILPRTPSARSQRSQIPLVVTNPSSPVPTEHTLPGPMLSTPILRPAASQPIAVMRQSPQPQSMVRRRPPLPAAATFASGPDLINEADFSILRPPPGPAPIPVSISSPVSPVFIPEAARDRQVIPDPPTIIRQRSLLSRRIQTPFQGTQPADMRTPPTRLSKRRRPQPTRADPIRVILPQTTGRILPPPQPEAVLMPARTESMRNRQSHRQLRPIDTSVIFPTSAVTAMTYPETVSRVRTTTQPSIAPFIIQQPSPVSSYDDLRASWRQPVVIRTSPSRLSSRRRPSVNSSIPPPRPISSNSSFRSSIRATERPVVIRRSPSSSPSGRGVQPTTTRPSRPSRLTKRRPQPTTADPVLPSQPIDHAPPLRQPEIVPMPAQTESARNRQNRRQLRPIDTSAVVPRPVTAMTYPETFSHARTTRTSTAFIPQPSPTSSESSSSIRRSPSRSPSHGRTQSATVTPTRPNRLTKRAPPPPQPNTVLMPTRTGSLRNRESGRQVRPIDTPAPAAVTALTYPETVSHVLTTARHPQPRPISSNSSFRSSVQAAERLPAVIRRSPSRSSGRHGPPPDTTTHTQPSRLTKRRPQPPPSPQPEIVVMPARTDSMRSRQNHRQLRPIDTSFGVPTTHPVTAMTYPETVSHLRTTAPPIIPLDSPITSNSSFRAPMQATKPPVIIRTSPSRPQHTTAGPRIVVLPPRSSHSTDSSPIIVSSSLPAPSHHQISAALGTLSDSPQPQSGAGLAMPLDSEVEEPTGFRPPVSRRPSFSGRDMISYESRSYSSDEGSASPPSCVTPTSFRGRTRSPRVQTPTSRQSQSPPRIYRQPDSTDLWDRQKHHAHSQRGWYRSGSVSPPAPNPLLRRRGSNKVSGHVTNTFSIHGEIRTRGAQQPFGNGVGLGEVVARGVVRGGLERPRVRRSEMDRDSRLKRKKSSWSGWLAGL